VSTHYYRFTRRGTQERRRTPLLEQVLARADASAPVSDWRADAFRVIAGPGDSMPGVGAAALYADKGTIQAASVFLATPVAYVAEMSNVRLPADGILSLDPPEADALAADFNRVWNDAGVRLLAGRRTDLFCVTDAPIAATTCDPEEVLDRHIEEYLPAGAAAARLRQLMSEIEMWLFAHAVNRTRLARGAPAVNGLWIWGGGPALSSLPPIVGWTSGRDPFFQAFATRPMVEGAATGAGAGVAVIGVQPGSDEWRDAEAHRLERSLADLRGGRITRLDLSAGDRCFSIGARSGWRFWRRRRPWWESFA
jgi:hypothetical protein